MDSGMVSKIEKARRYAQETHRVHFRQFELVFEGDHNTHTVRYDARTWECGCNFFAQRGICSHTMAMERILDGMLARQGQSVA